jgi:WD40 repeat protein
MNFINFEFILNFILPRLIYGSVVSLAIAVVVGSIVGLLIGAKARRNRRTVLRAIFGSFLGTMLLAMLPILFLQGRYGDGPYTILVMLVLMLFLVPIGSIAGAVVGSICGKKLPPKLKRRVSLMALVVTYSVMAIALHVSLAPAPFQSAKPSGQEQDILPLTGKIFGYEREMRCMAFTPDGQKLAIANSGDIRVWQVNSGKLLHTLKGPPQGQMTLKDWVDAIAITPDSKTLITAAPLEIQVRELETGRVLQRLAGGDYVKLTPDGKTLLGFVDMNTYNVRVWELSSGKLLHTIPTQLKPLDFSDTPLDISPDGKTLVIAPTPDKNQIELWQIDTGKRLKSFAGNTNDRITALAVTPEGKMLITAQTNTLQFWDFSSGKVVKTIPKVGNVKTLLLSLDGQRLISNGDRLSIWELGTGKSLQSWQNDQGKVAEKLALSPDGKTLAAYADKVVKLWRLP